MSQILSCVKAEVKDLCLQHDTLLSGHALSALCVKVSCVHVCVGLDTCTKTVMCIHMYTMACEKPCSTHHDGLSVHLDYLGAAVDASGGCLIFVERVVLEPAEKRGLTHSQLPQ